MPTQRSTVPRICEHCHEPFQARTDLIKIGKGQYCSRRCSGIVQQAAARERSFRDFWTHVSKPDEPHACWEWMRARDGNGYGRFLEFTAHRHAFSLAYGPIPDGLFVLHTCDNRACCRNDEMGWYEVGGVMRPRRGHLFLGTPSDNMIDRSVKGRANIVRGEDCYNTKLTWGDVRAIRAAVASGTKQDALAGRYDVSPMTISDIIRRATWKE